MPRRASRQRQQGARGEMRHLMALSDLVGGDEDEDNLIFSALDAGFGCDAEGFKAYLRG